MLAVNRWISLLEDPSAVAYIFHSFRKHTLMSQNQHRWKFGVALHICSLILSTSHGSLTDSLKQEPQQRCLINFAGLTEV